MKVLQINSDINSGSVGRIAEDLGTLLIGAGHESYAAYGRIGNGSSSSIIKIGGKADILYHLAKTRLTDRHGFGSSRATGSFLNEIEKIGFDVVHLHNIHGYYLNVKGLFFFIKKHKIPVVWTFHDCWPFTGHCSFFDAVNCYKWQGECYDCPNLHGYPESWFIDNSRKNFRHKKSIFSGLNQLILVSPSQWMAKHLQNSFLSTYNIKVINNGIDIGKFNPAKNNDVKTKYNLPDKYILGVANYWDKRKGLADFLELRYLLNPKIGIVLTGLSGNQAKKMPPGITGILRTENINDLAALYSGADIFVNPTYTDNFPSTNIEAMACGTPVITYNTGGSSESVSPATGLVVKKGDLNELHLAINSVLKKGKIFYSKACRRHVELNFNKENKLAEYITLYENMCKV
jgi:putative colanic acid biosynthesis glycosyltransferase